MSDKYYQNKFQLLFFFLRDDKRKKEKSVTMLRSLMLIRVSIIKIYGYAPHKWYHGRYIKDLKDFNDTLVLKCFTESLEMLDMKAWNQSI